MKNFNDHNKNSLKLKNLLYTRFDSQLIPHRLQKPKGLGRISSPRGLSCKSHVNLNALWCRNII